MGIIAALTGDPHGTIAAVHVKTEAGECRVVRLFRGPGIEAALAGIPVTVPRGARHPEILIEGGEYIGGPNLAAAAVALVGKPVPDALGRPQRRTWSPYVIQTASAERLQNASAWKTDVPRREVIAAFIDRLLRGAVKAQKDDPLAAYLKRGIEGLRAKRETDDDKLNVHEDLALCLALCVWWSVISQSAR